MTTTTLGLLVKVELKLILEWNVCSMFQCCVVERLKNVSLLPSSVLSVNEVLFKSQSDTRLKKFNKQKN